MFLSVSLEYITAYGAPITAFTTADPSDVIYTTRRGGAYVDIGRMVEDYEYLEALFEYYDRFDWRSLIN